MFFGVGEPSDAKTRLNVGTHLCWMINSILWSIETMSKNTRPGVLLAAVLSLSVLVPSSFRMAVAQPPAAPSADAAPANGRRQGGNRTMRANPVNEALKALTLTPEQDSKIKEIRAQSRKDLAAVTDRRSAEGMAKVRDINKKQVDDIKASLPADLQAKFQTAYDAAEKNGAAAAGLTEFKRPLQTLNLTPDEQAKVDPIAKDSYDKIVALRADSTLKPKDRTEKTETIITDMKAKIRPLLSADKQTQLDTLDLKPRPGRGGRRGQGGRGNGEAPPPPPATPPATAP
jgi:Spy/CpxP family protein refolding chaperone